MIIGGGFAGVAAARALRGCNAEVILIDRRNHHIFQPLLYQVATAVLAPSEVAAPIRQLARRQKNLSVMLAEVTGVDLKSRSVDADCPGVGVRKVSFDYLVIALGVQRSYFGHDEFAKHAPSLKTLTDAEAIRAKILGAYEFAESAEDPSERARRMTFVLVGAGPTGVELAASIALMATTTLRANFRRIDPAKTSILLFEGAPRILPSFAESLSKKVAKRLEKLGVKVVTGAKGRARGRARRRRRRKSDRECDGAVDRGGSTFTDCKDARHPDRPRGSRLRRTLAGSPDDSSIFVIGDQLAVTRRGSGFARRCPSGDPAGSVCRTS